MNCEEIREILSSYVDGEARGDEARLAEEHLAACAGCRELARRMQVLGEGVAKVEGVVPPGFREALFSRMESEGLLPRRRSLFVYSIRWAAVPLAAAAALALLLLSPREAGRVGQPSAPQAPAAREARDLPQVARRTSEAAKRPAGQEPGGTAVASRGDGELTAEERDIVAHLEMLEDPAALEEPTGMDELDIVEPAVRRKG